MLDVPSGRYSRRREGCAHRVSTEVGNHWSFVATGVGAGRTSTHASASFRYSMVRGSSKVVIFPNAVMMADPGRKDNGLEWEKSGTYTYHCALRIISNRPS